MNILADFHHSSLFSSYLYTLESRLGHSVYRQIGTRWFTEGYWKLNKQQDTIQQYLGTYGYQPTDGTPSLNQVMWVQDGIYYSRDPNTQQIHKAITFEKFVEMDFDVIIASIPQHIKPFQDLARMKKAKMIFQEGNNFHLPDDFYPNLMSSTFPRATTCHSVFYHQEFDLNYFTFKPQSGKKIISNFMNVLQNYPESLQWFEALEQEMPDYQFKMYGAQNRDGCLTGVNTIAKTMQESRWIFHVKPGGDGYGHSLHNAFASGRPVITLKRHYEGHLAGRMMNDQTCIIIDSMTPKQAAQSIRSHEERYDEMCKTVKKTFDDYVDFEKDAQKIQHFLDNLK